MPNTLSYLRFLDLSEAGGIRHEFFFDSIDSFTRITNGGGTTGFTDGILNVAAGTVSAGNAVARKTMEFSHFDFSWNKKRIFKTKARLTVPNVAGTYGLIYTGYLPGDGPAIGFKVTKDGIYGYAHMYGSPTEILIKPFTAPPYEEKFLLQATLFPGSRIEFQVNDGTTLYTVNLTTGLPSGFDDSLTFFGAYVEAVDNHRIVSEFCSFYFFQDI